MNKQPASSKGIRNPAAAGLIFGAAILSLAAVFPIGSPGWDLFRFLGRDRAKMPTGSSEPAPVFLPSAGSGQGGEDAGSAYDPLDAAWRVRRAIATSC